MPRAFHTGSAPIIASANATITPSSRTASRKSQDAAAAFADPRFEPLRADEWPGLKVEVSLFGRPTSIELDYTQLKGY